MNYRNDLISLIPDGGVCAELGVGGGVFSNTILEQSKASKLYSIDRYANDRGHNLTQFTNVAKLLWKYDSRSVLIGSDFVEALKLFQDKTFDFIYIDGYAHEGYYRTLVDWWWKLDHGGIFAVHDYHEQFPNNVAAIDKFRTSIYADLKLTSKDQYPSWWTIKE